MKNRRAGLKHGNYYCFCCSLGRRGARLSHHSTFVAFFVVVYFLCKGVCVLLWDVFTSSPINLTLLSLCVCRSPSAPSCTVWWTKGETRRSWRVLSTSAKTPFLRWVCAVDRWNRVTLLNQFPWCNILLCPVSYAFQFVCILPFFLPLCVCVQVCVCVFMPVCSFSCSLVFLIPSWYCVIWLGFVLVDRCNMPQASVRKSRGLLPCAAELDCMEMEGEYSCSFLFVSIMSTYFKRERRREVFYSDC